MLSSRTGKKACLVDSYMERVSFVVQNGTASSYNVILASRSIMTARIVSCPVERIELFSKIVWNSGSSK